MKKTSEKQIQEWKEKHGGVFHFQVEDKECFLRTPKMRDFKRAFNALQNETEIAFGEEMLKALWLDGDTDIINDDEYFFPARRQITELLKYEDAEITKSGTGHLITIEGVSVQVRPITREDLKIAERRNPSQKPFVTQEILFDNIKTGDVDPAFDDKDNPEIRFPLYKAIEDLQKKKVAQIKKL